MNKEIKAQQCLHMGEHLEMFTRNIGKSEITFPGISNEKNYRAMGNQWNSLISISYLPNGLNYKIWT